ncbi:unnamed protein product, partial [Laminaria digitata]
AVSLLLVIRFPLLMLPMAVASWIQAKVSLGRMQKFFELEELHPGDRKWTSRDGNVKGAGSLSLSGKYIWNSADEDDDDNDNDSNDAVTNDKTGGDNGNTLSGSDSSVYSKHKAKAAAVGPAVQGGKRLAGGRVLAATNSALDIVEGR